MIRPEPEIIFTFVQTKRSMKVLYTALLALLLFPSCRRQSGDIDSFLHNAESLMNEHPEDALSIIRHIDRRKIYSSPPRPAMRCSIRRRWTRTTWM